MTEQDPKDPLIVVGIGASAGGLEAISKLLSCLEPNINCALVVLQHLSPNYKSMMPELLSRETRLTVKPLSDKTIPKPGIVYVVPPNRNATISDGVVHLTEAAPESSPRPSINHFLNALAAEKGSSAIGIILSGTGSDGTHGLKAIQSAGGTTLIQSPETAKYEGMPSSAQEQGVADFVLPINDIAAKLMTLVQLTTREGPESRSAIDTILQTFKADTGMDFSGYKIGTLVRRIRRRVAAIGMPDMESYLSYMGETPGEGDLLAREVMVSVTSFFRDQTAIEALREHLSERIKSLSPNEEVRAWIAGCATGEEAYSIAILLLDALAKAGANNPVQVFATDIDEDALGVARRGIYSDLAVNSVPTEFIQRFFIKRGDNQFEVNKNLRDIVVFARHNLISDPPFLRLNLVSCRNVLIYFEPPLQAKVLQRLNFALKENGLLFLGRSESIAQADSRFYYLDRRERVFSKTSEGENKTEEHSIEHTLSTFQLRRKEHSNLIADATANKLGVVAFLCSSDGLIVQTLGATQQLFESRHKQPYPSLVDGLFSPFKSHAVALMHKWQRTKATQRSSLIRFQNESWRMNFSSVTGNREERLLVMISPAPAALSDTTESIAAQVYTDELQVTHEQLQSLVEELATANEEMQSLNEEAQASNEELQATNEELEAANEELQATNEELISVNEELGVRTSELKTLNQEYSHLYDSFDFPVMVFNKNLRLTRFNAAAGQKFGLAYSRTPNDAISILLPAYLSDLSSFLKTALEQGEKQEFTTRDNDRYFHIIISPAVQDSDNTDFLVVNVIDITDIQNTRNQLDESKARLQTIMQNTTVLIAMKDLTGRYLYANMAFLDCFKLNEKNYLHKSDFDLLPENLAAQLWASDLNAIRTLKMIKTTTTIDGDQGPRYFSSRHQILRDHTGKPDMLIVEMEDITEQRLADDKLRIAAKVFQQAGEAIVVTDDESHILSINDAFTRITGYHEDEAIGHKIGQLLNSGKHEEEFFSTLWASLNQSGRWQGEIWNQRKNGEIYPEWLTITRVLNQQEKTDYFIAVFSDISNLKESQSQIEFLATHDTLTGLPNRTLFLDRLENALARSKRSEEQVAVLFLDLDNFKSINDTLGHDTGDKLLIKVAQILVYHLRDEDTVARLGGDEFTILLNDCKPQYAEEIAQRILDSLNEPVEVDGRRIFTSASIGLSFFPEDSSDSLGLLKAADTALYRAKEAGRGRYCFFHSDMRDTLVKQSTLESALREALRNRHFRLVYQPKISSQNQTMIGAEALLRWYDPTNGDIAPAEFIPIAEKGSSIIDLSHLVIDTLAHQMARWHSRGLSLPRVSFNVSPHCLKLEYFSQEIIRIIDGYLVPPDRFQVEITESSLMGDSRNAKNNIQAFKDKGLGISIDDFGTGYSSLSYLKQLPLDELKIDKGFVDGLGSDENDEAICEAILSISKALHLQVVAEGVETTQQSDWLREHGCHYLQGYLFSKPLESAEFETLLLTQTSEPYMSN